jgi:hypothetical protein
MMILNDVNLYKIPIFFLSFMKIRFFIFQFKSVIQLLNNYTAFWNLFRFAKFEGSFFVVSIIAYLALVTCLITYPLSADASTLHHWRFESDAADRISGENLYGRLELSSVLPGEALSEQLINRSSAFVKGQVWSESIPLSSIQPLTAEFFMKFDLPDQSGRLMTYNDHHDPTENGKIYRFAFGFYLNANQSVTWMVAKRGIIATEATSSTVLLPGVWYHISGTWDGVGNATIFINHSAESSASNQALVGVSPPDSPSLALSGFDEVEATYDEVRLSDTVLTPDKMLHGSLHHWKFENSSAKDDITGVDISGRGSSSSSIPGSHLIPSDRENSSSRYVEAQNEANVRSVSGQQSLTAECFVKLDRAAQSGRLVTYNDHRRRAELGKFTFGFYLNDDRTVTWKVTQNGGAAALATSFTPLRTGIWYHIAGTWDGTGNSILYVNRVREATASNLTVSLAPHPEFPSLALSSLGSIQATYDELRLSGTVITPEQMLGTSPAISIDTYPRPEMSTFIPGETINLNIRVQELHPGQRLKLVLSIVNEMDTLVERQEYSVNADSNGNWFRTASAPNNKLGFYRVWVELSDGTTLPSIWSKPRGFITYAVVPDPTQRKLYREQDSFFGLMGSYNRSINVLPYLGIRWVTEPRDVIDDPKARFTYEWALQEPDFAGQFARRRKEAAGDYPLLYFDGSWNKIPATQNIWKVFTLPTLFMVSGTQWARAENSSFLAPEHEQDWVNYCREAVKAFMANYPERNQHLYQITWEPGLEGPISPKQLARIYELAYPSIHQVDPKAVVIGPTKWRLYPDELEVDRAWLDAGLENYIDAWAVHPYLPSWYSDVPLNQEEFIQSLRALKTLIQERMGKETLVYSTEQGFNSGGIRLRELRQARSTVMSNIILLGEGISFHISFYNQDIQIPMVGNWGFYYDMGFKQGIFYTDRISPKPIVPAYAAMSFILEGHKSLGEIPNLPNHIRGYKYKEVNDKDTVEAVWWDCGNIENGLRQTVNIPVGSVDKVEIFDWMGNSSTRKVSNGFVNLQLDENPTYIKWH